MQDYQWATKETYACEGGDTTVEIRPGDTEVMARARYEAIMDSMFRLGARSAFVAVELVRRPVGEWEQVTDTPAPVQLYADQEVRP